MLNDELVNLNLGDKRLKKRSIKLLEVLGSKSQQSIPCACNGWGETKAAYLLSHRQPLPDTPPTINEMIRTISTFGGFLNRKGMANLVFKHFGLVYNGSNILR